jgi:hypothetical protein
VRRRSFFLVFAVVALLLAGVVSLFASSSPDGLERVARDQGISRSAQQHRMQQGPMADYGVHAIDNGWLSGGLAGVAGVLVVLALTSGVVYAVRRKSTGHDGPHPVAGTVDAGSRGR